MRDFRSYMALLEERGDVVHVTKEVDPKFELAALMCKIENAGKAYAFENVKGAQFPLVGGHFTSLERYKDLHDIPKDQPFSRLEHAKILERAVAEPLEPKIMNTGAVKDVIKVGDAINLSELPIPTFFEDDSGAFITGAVGISRNPATGELNVGTYRSLKLDDQTLTVNASTMSDLRSIYNHHRDSGEEMHLALAIGVDPALLMAAVGKPPATVSEFGVAGGLREEPLALVKAEHSDLLVPADAEIIIEGVIDFSQEIEHTLGEFAGQYGPETNPLFRVTAITHRKDPNFYCILAGANPEHNTVGSVAIYSAEKSIMEDLVKQFPIIKALHVVIDAKVAGPMLQLFIQIDKKSDDEPMELIKAAFESTAGYLPVSLIFKRIVVVDGDIDIYNYNDVEWAIWSRVADASKIHLIPEAVSWELERSAASKEGHKSFRIGIDATMDLEDVDKLKRPIIPGFDDVRVEDFV